MESTTVLEEQSLQDLGFTQSQIEKLNHLRHVYIEREQKQSREEQRRLEFARWLVSTGRMTDKFADVDVVA